MKAKCLECGKTIYPRHQVGCDSCRGSEFTFSQDHITGLINSRSDAVLQCYSCQEELTGIDISAYAHPQGWSIRGVDKKLWLSIHCTKCHYDTSLNNFGISR